MSPDLFPKYLKDTSLLYRISYEELKTLVVQYPYCQNLRYLLLVKSKMDGNSEQDRNMKMASAYSQDRTKLYLLLKDDLKQVKKDFEFLDLDHAVTDDNHPELELPILDFSNGIDVSKSKKSKRIAEELDLFLDSNLSDSSTSDSIDKEEEHPVTEEKITTENISEDLLSLFKEDEEDEEKDSLVKEALTSLAMTTTVQESEKEETLDSWENPLVPPAIDFSFISDSETEGLVEEKEIPAVPALPLIPPAIDLPFRFMEEAQEEKEMPAAFALPLVPPRMDLSFAIEEDEGAEVVAASVALVLPVVPPSIDLIFVQHAALEEIIPETVIKQNSFQFPMVPPLHGITFAEPSDSPEEKIPPIPEAADPLIIKETEETTDLAGDEIDQSIQEALERLANVQKTEAEKEDWTKEAKVSEILESDEPIIIEDLGEVPNFGDEIDQSIQEALERLANAQRIELEQEEAEEEARVAAIIKKEMILEGIIKEKEEKKKAKEEKEITKLIQEENKPPANDKSKTDYEGPMPKASFNSWLKQMAAPTPSLEENESDQKSERKAASSKKSLNTPKKKKAKKKKRKKTGIENEGSRLIKAIKARQKRQQKEETAMMLVRKRKVIELAERSLKENEEIVSETLAKILAIQGKKDKAAYMYRRLMLKFPKKSSFFAAELKKILK